MKCRFVNCNSEANYCAKPPYDNMCFECYYEYMLIRKEEKVWRKNNGN